MILLLPLAGLAGCSAAASDARVADSDAVRMVAVAGPVDHALGRPPEWYRTGEGRRFADVVVSWQNANGGWWKKYDPERPRPAILPAPDEHDGPPGDTEDAWRPTSTFDNGATIGEMRVLARAHTATGDARYRDAFVRGLRFIFDAQYPNGGWPQRFPLQDNYGRHITFNDNAMVNVMSLLRDVATGAEPYGFVADADRERCRASLRRAVDCVVASQIRVGGKPTGWCQQHDAATLAPTTGRTYEPPCIASAETAGIVLFLMELPDPDSRVRDAIESAVRWFDSAKILGIRVERVSGPQYEKGQDRVVVKDPAAPPVWARMYDIETGRPIFSGRDGVKRLALAEIEHERRTNYGWYGDWGLRVREQYERWKSHQANE